MRANSWRSSLSLPVMYDNKAPHSHGEKRAMSSVLQLHAEKAGDSLARSVDAIDAGSVQVVCTRPAQ